MEMGRGGACVPARVAPQGRIHRSCPRTMRVFLLWKRRYADVRAGTQAPPLRISFGWIARGWLMSFGQVARGMGDFVWGGLRVGEVLFVGENGAHEPTPSVLYFCQPRVADERRLPWGKSWRGTYAIGIVLFKINFRAGNHLFAACGDDV